MSNKDKFVLTMSITDIIIKLINKLYVIWQQKIPTHKNNFVSIFCVHLVFSFLTLTIVLQMDKHCQYHK